MRFLSHNELLFVLLNNNTSNRHAKTMLVGWQDNDYCLFLPMEKKTTSNQIKIDFLRRNQKKSIKNRGVRTATMTSFTSAKTIYEWQRFLNDYRITRIIQLHIKYMNI